MRTLAVIALLLASGSAIAAPADTRDLRAGVTSDRPLVGPYSRAAGWPSVYFGTPAQMSEMNYFNAPSYVTRCNAVVTKRVEGRLVRACE